MSVVFYSTFPGTRPIRLCEKTREFARESLDGKYGKETMETRVIPADEFENFEEFTTYEKYDTAIRLITERAPIRLCKNELLCGSATEVGS